MMPVANARGCRNLDIYKISHAMGLRIHAMSLKLPWFEQVEEARQVRRSSKSVSAQIVEGYRQRRYRDLFLSYLHRAVGSADETREHLDYLFETGSFRDESLYEFLKAESDRLLGKLTSFIVGVERNHTKPYYLG